MEPLPRLTKNRRLILETLKVSSSPRNAMDLYQELHNQINLATVYRGLLHLEEVGYISGVTIACKEEGTVRYFFLPKNPHEHFFHCEACHRFIPVHGCALDSMVQEVEQGGHKVQSHFLYFTGICSNCQKGITP